MKVKISKIPTLVCLRCRHTWKQRKDEEPKCCPGCHSPYWNVPRKEEHKAETHEDGIFESIMKKGIL